MKILYVTIGIALLIALLALIPLLGFWAIDTLFAYSIPLTWSNGIAFWILLAMVQGGNATLKRGVAV